MVIPDTKENVSLLIRETIEDVLKFAQRVSCSWNEKTVNYHILQQLVHSTCKVIAQKSPQGCSMSPRPV